MEAYIIDYTLVSYLTVSYDDMIDAVFVYRFALSALNLCLLNPWFLPFFGATRRIRNGEPDYRVGRVQISRRNKNAINRTTPI